MAALVRLLADGRWEWLEGDARTRTGDFDAWLTSVGGGPVRLLVPGEAVLVTEVTLVARQRHKLLQALPYAVEDQLIEDIDRYHFALGPRLAGDRYLVAAVGSDIMDAWLAPFEDAAIEVLGVVPDTLALPVETGCCVVLADDERWLIRHGDAETYAAFSSEFRTLIELASADRVVIHGRTDADLDAEWERASTDLPALALLAGWLPRSRSIDLLQGDYAHEDVAGRRQSRLWWGVAALLLAVLVVETGIRGYRVWQGESRLAELQAEAASLLRQTFPDVQRVVDPRLQMAQRLDEVRGGQAGIEAGVLYLLRLAGPALANDAAVQLRALTYRNGALTVEVEAPDLTRVEALRQRVGSGSLQARIESATTLDDQVRARLRIGEAL